MDFSLGAFAGFVNREPARLIADRLEENRVSRELQGNKRRHLSNDQRRRLAAKGKLLGRRLLDKVAVRAVHIAGVTPHPTSKFTAQVARNLTDSVVGFVREVQFLVVDNDTLFTRLMSDLARCFAATAIRPDGLSPRRQAGCRPRTEPTVCLLGRNRQLVFGHGRLEATNSTRNGLGPIDGHCGHVAVAVSLFALLPIGDGSAFERKVELANSRRNRFGRLSGYHALIGDDSAVVR